MTSQQAQLHVQAILGGLDQRGLLPARGIFTLRGGQLTTTPHAEDLSQCRVVWEPSRNDLRPLDLEDFSVGAAVDQVGRYRHAAYLPVRRRLEGLLEAIGGEGFQPLESHQIADSYGEATLEIVERFRGAGHEPEFRIELEWNAAVRDESQGDRHADPVRSDVTDTEWDEVVALIKRANGR